MDATQGRRPGGLHFIIHLTHFTTHPTQFHMPVTHWLWGRDPAAFGPGSGALQCLSSNTGYNTPIVDPLSVSSSPDLGTNNLLLAASTAQLPATLLE